MKETEIFADSYAIIEMLKGNRNYARFSEMKLATTRLNLVEVAYCLLKEFPEEKVKEMIGCLAMNTLELADNEVMPIAAFRKEHARKALSYTDCIGYFLAKKNNIPFLTGDKQFREMPGVEFIK